MPEDRAQHLDDIVVGVIVVVDQHDVKRRQRLGLTATLGRRLDAGLLRLGWFLVGHELGILRNCGTAHQSKSYPESPKCSPRLLNQAHIYDFLLRAVSGFHLSQRRRRACRDFNYRPSCRQEIIFAEFISARKRSMSRAQISPPPAAPLSAVKKSSPFFPLAIALG